MVTHHNLDDLLGALGFTKDDTAEAKSLFLDSNGHTQTATRYRGPNPSTPGNYHARRPLMSHSIFRQNSVLLSPRNAPGRLRRIGQPGSRGRWCATSLGP